MHAGCINQREVILLKLPTQGMGSCQECGGLFFTNFDDFGCLEACTYCDAAPVMVVKANV